MKLVQRLVVLVVAVAVAGGCGDSDRSPQPPPSTTPSEPVPSTAAGVGVGPGPWIAYQTDRSGPEAVWLIRPDGSDDQRLATGLTAAAVLPDWSPDGKRLVFSSRAGLGDPLYEFDLSSGDSRQLFACDMPCLGDDEPAYAPDGTQVAFIRASGPIVDSLPSDSGIWVGNRDTGQVRKLTSNQACDREYFLRWSPDGQNLTYHRELRTDSDELTTAAFILRADGTGERRLTPPDMVAGSPD